MAPTLPNGTIVPRPTDGISATGNQEVITLGTSIDNQLATKADIDYVDQEVTENAWYRGNLPDGTDLSTWTTPGQYTLNAAYTYSSTPPGFASGSAATFEMWKGSGAWGTQRVAQYGTAQYMASRTSIPGGYGAWDEDSAMSRNSQMRHQLRVDEFKRRRGGVIGLGGKGAVTFRFDHYYQDWATKIRPLMQQHQIIGTMAMHGNNVQSGTGVGAAGYTWADLQATHINEGLEIMCHSYSHQGAQTASQMETEIVWIRDNWHATNMPQVLIEGWMQPGAVFGDMGSAIGDAQKLWNTLAGRTLMAHYALVSGHRDGYYQQLTGDVDAGLAHVTIEEETTAAPVKAIIDKAVATRTGVIFMMHPNVIGTSGHMPTAVLGEIFAYVAQLRDQGKLQNVTAGGLALADSLSDRREDLAINGSFTDGLTDWTAGAGWTVANGRALSPADTASTAVISQSDYISRRAVIAGSPREVVVTARGLSGSTILRVTVRDASSGTVLNTYRDLVFPSGSFSTQRMFFTIPYSRGALPAITLEWTVQQRGSFRAEVDSIQVRAI